MAPSKHAAILRRLGVALTVLTLALFAYRVRRAFIPFFLAIGIGYIISPLVRMAERRGAPRAAAIFTAYVLVVAVIGFSLAFVLPPLATQLDEIVGVFSPDAGVDGLAADWRRRLQLLPEGAASRLAAAAVDRAEEYISEVARAAGRAV
ncbi:MAG: AI-2E family transporter, partial [Firmicutes bacterium]|nr:AI-2E family transporter [Bacillota bacterium]